MVGKVGMITPPRPRASFASDMEVVGIIRQTTEAEADRQEEPEERASELEKHTRSGRSGHDPKTVRTTRLLRAACCALLCLLALLAAIRIAVQTLVCLSSLEIHRFSLSDPWDGSAAAVVEGAIAIPVALPFLAVLDISQLDIMYDGRALGALRPEAPLQLRHGGRVSVSLSGRVYVLEPRAFRALADALLHQPLLQLELQSELVARVSLPPALAAAPLLGWMLQAVLTVSSVHFYESVQVQGSNGLNVIFKRFVFTDGQPLPGCTRQFAPLHPTSPPFEQPAAGGAALVSATQVAPPDCSADRPLDVEMEVSVSNPSSFEFDPLGELELVIQDPRFITFATCRTAQPVRLPYGNSSIVLRGTVTVAPGTEPQFSAALASYMAGEPTHLSAAFSRVSNHLYHRALSGLTVPAVLPGLADARLFRSVGLILDPGWNVLQLALGSALSDGARLQVHNPLNITVAVLGLSATVQYLGQEIAQVVLPVVDPPIVMAPLWSGTPDVIFPVRLAAPLPTLQTLLARLAIGSVEVDLFANMTVRVGNTTNTVGFAQSGVPVYLG